MNRIKFEEIGDGKKLGKKQNKSDYMHSMTVPSKKKRKTATGKEYEIREPKYKPTAGGYAKYLLQKPFVRVPQKNKGAGASSYIDKEQNENYKKRLDEADKS